MLISSALCFAQEAHQRQRATDNAFANVRAIAAKAATAWRIEGVAAEAREQRQLRVRAFKVSSAAGEALTALSLSENPDRGFADF